MIDILYSLEKNGEMKCIITMASKLAGEHQLLLAVNPDTELVLMLVNLL